MEQVAHTPVARKRSARPPGIFCIETDWDANLTRQSSVAPLLNLLSTHVGARSVHRSAATAPEFEHYLKKWTQKRYDAYPFGYFAFHGAPGNIFVGRQQYSLTDLGNLLYRRCRSRILYFGSCSTLAVPRSDIRELGHATSARAVIGYKKEVDWLESAAFELLLIEAVTLNKRSDVAYRWLKSRYPDVCRNLGLVFEWK